MPIIFYFSAGIIAVLIPVGLVLLRGKKKLARFRQSLGMTLFSIKMPKYEKQEEKEIKSLIEGMEQIYAHFLYLKKTKGIEKIKGYETSRIALEIASEAGGSDISFYIAVPKYMASSLEKTVQGVYSQAVVKKIPNDYTVFEPKAKVAGARVLLKEPLYLPLQTYQTLQTDPIAGITNALSKIKPEEGSAVQIILRPARLNIKKQAEKILGAILEKGITPKQALAEANKSPFLEIMSDIFSALFGSAKKAEQKKEQELKAQSKPGPAGNELTIEGIKAKAKKPIFETNIRLIGIAGEKSRAEEILNHLEEPFFQFASSLNQFETKKIKKRHLKKFVYDFSFRNFNQGERVVLNIEELTSIFHFPLSHSASPQIRWAKTKEVAPPSDLPKNGLNLLGQSLFRGEQKQVYFASREDRRRHFYIIGQTGVGKSSLLQEMIRQDIENGEGVGVVDPNGDLIEHTLANIPKERAEDVFLFEPFDMERPCGLNMLEWKSPEQKDFAISEMITIYSKLFPPEIIGPMFEHYMRNAMLALMADKDDPGTLVEIPRIFTDKDFMENRLMNVKDPLVRSFWLKEWAQTTGQTRSDMLGYVVSKVGRFVENEMMRNIIGQTNSSFDFSDIMNNKKIFLANLSKGQTGEMNSSLLGLILISKMQIAAFRRSEVSEEERKDFYLYVDEFQNFTTDSIATILSEARKYRLNLILAHQYMPQLTEPIRNAVVGNVGSMAAFRVGADDAEFLEKQFSPEFSKFDLLNLDNFNLILKMMINNQVASPFKLAINRPEQGDKQAVAAIKKLAKLKYGRAKEEVEAEISERSRLGA